MNTNYEYYRIFYYVAKYQNITQAAEMLHSNQPNVSRVIKLLEHELGCPLLIRSRRGVTLTPEGQRLYAHVKVAVEAFTEGEDEVMRMRRLEEGRLTIDATDTALRMIVLPALKQFKEKYPKIHVRILNHYTAAALQTLRSHTADFSVIATPVEIARPLKATPITELHGILIGGSAFSHLKDQVLSLSELRRYPLIGPSEQSAAYQFYKSFYRSHGLELKPDLEAAATDLILPMVKSNLGIGFTTTYFAEKALRAGEVYQIHLAEPIPPRQILFVENEEQPLSLAAKELKTLLFHRASPDANHMSPDNLPSG